MGRTLLLLLSSTLLFSPTGWAPAKSGPKRPRPTASSDPSLIALLLRDIASRQQKGDGFYFPGSFPGTRVHASTPILSRDDNNIFFTGLISLGLKGIRDGLDGEDKTLCDSILKAIPGAYPYYQNREGRMTFNFWQTNPPVIFPGDPTLEALRKTHALPDDLDDTSILLSTIDDLSDSSARAVKALMEAHANHSTGVLRNGYRRYKEEDAYSTWFGQRMPIDIDCSVLCNVLFWVCKSGLPFTRTDSASMEVIRDVVLRGLTVRDPAYASPHYGRAPVIIYNMARLLGAFSIPTLDSLKPLLIEQARGGLPQATSYLDRVLLSTSLLRLGVPAADVPLIPVRSLDEADQTFVFFIASFSDYFRNPFRRLFLQNRLIRYEFRCVAFNRLLLLEYLLVRKASLKRAHPGF